MEVAPSGPRISSEPPRRRGTPLPLSQLVEESRSRSRASVPNPLLDSKIYARATRTGRVEAEPSELHFSGFELGRSYTKVLKLINVSSEVMNMHIVPTQTRHFQTAHAEQGRLIPGLGRALRVTFRADEWRYFYDCVRVHCEDEENLLVPVHAYPVIGDLRVPPRIDLPAVPLGQSVRRAVPLRCSCPVDFDFQVFVVQPHEAFSVRPHAGVIPAGGEASVAVTFRPRRYETSQFTFQLVVSQFNTKPYLCTVTGSCAPRSALSDAPLEENPAPGAKRPPRRKGGKRKSEVKGGPAPSADVCSPAAAAKTLMKDVSKLTSKDLQRALSGTGAPGNESRRIREALFVKTLRLSETEEQANRLKWQVHLGVDPMSEQTRLQILKDREAALHEYSVRREDGERDEDFAAGPARLSSTRALRDAGQDPGRAPAFQPHTGVQWELKRRAVGLFQQAARKVVLRCRMTRRLASLKQLKSPTSAAAKEKKTSEFRVSPDKVFPTSFPAFSDEEDPSALGKSAEEPVDPIDVSVTTRIPFFKLQVPQRWKLMDYQPVPTWEAFNDYVPTALARPLRSGAPDPFDPRVTALGAEDGEEPVAPEDAAEFSFSAPDALLGPFPANPLRIFNPAPGLRAYKPGPKYLESDLEFHLCPLPRYGVPESNAWGGRTQTPRARKEAIGGLSERRRLDPISASEQLAGSPVPRRFVDFDAELLPVGAPPPLAAALPDDPPPPTDDPRPPGVQLSPQMIGAEFLRGRAPVAGGNLIRPGREHQPEVTLGAAGSRMRERAAARLKQLDAADGTSQSPGEEQV
ncbi:cilia- and flagella-associated protein 221 isoform X2 [Kryptolebias marmoratus]|uniref:cilia- and flagella-associated protein 221 isoform X2 n=1 Tax=Kryptolebias marmoratus TaxID=37003 RepID=UPI0007F89FA5|nr:cilia- and flagella-associated protein 221 isoform X2 [Kryptolebias marmoratus]